MQRPGHVVLQSHVTNKIRAPDYQSAYVHQTWQDGISPWWDAPHKVTWPFGHAILQTHLTNENHYISTTRVPMTNKLGKMMIYFEELLTIKSFYALITWSCKVTWQTKIIIYPQPKCLWREPWQNDNWTWWVLTYKVTSPIDHVVLQGHVIN